MWGLHWAPRVPGSWRTDIWSNLHVVDARCLALRAVSARAPRFLGFRSVQNLHWAQELDFFVRFDEASRGLDVSVISLGMLFYFYYNITTKNQ